MDLKDFAQHFNVTSEQQDFIIQYGFNEVADKLGEVPESLSESFIRRELAHNLNMRNTPNITFVMDQSIAYGVAMSKKIDDLTKDIKEEEE